MELIKGMNLGSVQRIQYSNLESQQIWTEKFQKASTVYPALEYLTVAHGVRDCMIDHFVSYDNITVKATEYSKLGLYMLPLTEEYLGGGFSHSAGNMGTSYIRTVVSNNKDKANMFLEAHLNSDHVTIGQLLGFPYEACLFFDRAWEKGYYDPIWQQAENTSEPMLKSKRDVVIDGKVKQKIIRLNQIDDFNTISSVFRYLTVRTISHFPKSFDDKESLEVSRKWIQLAKDLKLDGLDEVLDIMKLPYRWDCYKGIAEVTTPVFRFMVNSMNCYPRHIIEQESDFYPKEAPFGVGFPFQTKTSCGGSK